MPTIILTSGSTWDTPADWDNANNTIECWGAGGSPANTSNKGGGGGSGYSFQANVTITGTITIQVGTAATGQAGGATWFNGATLAASSCGANGGSAPAGVLAGGAGGSVTGAIGSTKIAGEAGTSGTSSGAGGGGGGAAGPLGTGTGGSNAALNTGGTGGTGNNGSGGAGGTGGLTTVDGTPGISNTEGGGGGGGGGHAANGALGGTPGGGGGGEGALGTSAGLGGTGQIRIIYTPLVPPPTTNTPPETFGSKSNETDVPGWKVDPWLDDRQSHDQEYWDLRERYLRRFMEPVLREEKATSVKMRESGPIKYHEDKLSEGQSHLALLQQARDAVVQRAREAVTSDSLRKEVARVIKLTLDISSYRAQYYERAAIILLLDLF